MKIIKKKRIFSTIFFFLKLTKKVYLNIYFLSCRMIFFFYPNKANIFYILLIK